MVVKVYIFVKKRMEWENVDPGSILCSVYGKLSFFNYRKKINKKSKKRVNIKRKSNLKLYKKVIVIVENLSGKIGRTITSKKKVSRNVP